MEEINMADILKTLMIAVKDMVSESEVRERVKIDHLSLIDAVTFGVK
jgi:hypothetical protein